MLNSTSRVCSNDRSTTSSSVRECVSLDPIEQKAYNSTSQLLLRPTSFLAPFPSVVSLRDLAEEPLTPPPRRTQAATNPSIPNVIPQPSSHQRPQVQQQSRLYQLSSFDVEEATPASLLSPNKGHHALFHALEKLEGLEKEEASLLEHSPLTAPLTEIVTNQHASSASDAIRQLEAFGSIPRRVCQHPFKRNDIVWVCRTCQADETCVLCERCWSNSNHEGHDVAFYHAQAGGCCDCGDPDAWDPAGFCNKHGPTSGPAHDSFSSRASPLAHDQVKRVRGAVPSVVDWLVERIAENAEVAYQRSQTKKNGCIGVDLEMSDIEDANSIMKTGMDDDNNSNNEEDDANNNITDSREDGMFIGDEDENDINVFQDGIFSPIAASRSSRSHLNSGSNQPQHVQPNGRAEALGKIGLEGHGLYLVLFADDIHSPSQWIDALRNLLGASSYYTDSLLAKYVRALRQYGQLVVWGTMELVAEVGAINANLWLDGNANASHLMGNAILQRASRLIQNGFFCSIMTRQELQLEQRAVSVLQWMSALARSCDPLCQTVAECILPNRHLVPLLNVDFKLSSRITKAWYSLLLTLLAVPTFKSSLAAAYCDTYRSVTAKYASGMGLLERSAYTLSVQFLNRVTYVVDLVQGRDLLGKLGKSLLDTLKVARRQTATDTSSTQPLLNPNHFVLSHRRYSPCISDLKCVLNVKGMKRLFACEKGTFLQDWVSALSIAQFMDTQVWRHWTQGHVEDEVRGWVGAFNLSISLGSLFERLLSWDDNEKSPITDPSSPLSGNLMSCKQLTFHILMSGISPWQNAESAEYQPTIYASAIDPHVRSPASLAFSNIAAKHGCALAFQQLSIAQVAPFSFHLPLHRFLAACLREVCLRPQSAGGMEELLDLISSQLPPKELDTLFRGLMEFPVLVLTRASQVRAGLWRRNGPGLNDQVLNYAEPPFCRSMRDADLLLVQFAVLKRSWHQSAKQRPKSDVGMSFLIHLLLHRLGIFDFAGLTKAPNSDINRYLRELSDGLYPPELLPESRSAPSTENQDLVLPWTYSPARDVATRLVLLEEFLHLMVIFMIELPPLPPRDRDDHTRQAKERLRREVIHRLASGPKTHSELSEVHLVLSHWDNVFLSEEGKLINPEDATGAALGVVLEEVADRKSGRVKLEPDKWELRRPAWEAYDPSFFHISLRSHQTAAENRPRAMSPGSSGSLFGQVTKSYGPVTLRAHPSFERLRRDVTADATLLAIVYRILHLHCRGNKPTKDVADLRGGKFAYEHDERSETALARAVHILTLGAHAWETASARDSCWREMGGGSSGSVFYDRTDDESPSVNDWIEAALLADPGAMLDCEWYSGEEKAIELLRRLAVDGGIPGSFVAGDASVRSGAAWLCEFSARHCPAVAAQLGTFGAVVATDGEAGVAETELQKKKRIAKERAMARMKDQAAKFASLMKVELKDGDDRHSENNVMINDLSFSSTGSDPVLNFGEISTSDSQQHHHHPARLSSLGSTHSSSSASVATSGADSERSLGNHAAAEIAASSYVESAIPNRLLKVRPQCIICNDESNADNRPKHLEDDTHTSTTSRKSRRKKLDGGNALGFVAYVQASTVLKGGGGPPCAEDSMMSPVRRFVGAHAALCGHAVHSECCETYLAIVSHREDRVIGKRDEFRCPLCQRLSNSLVPFIDVGEDWICSPTSFGADQSPATVNEKREEDADTGILEQKDDPSSPASIVSLQDYLNVTPWWVSRHNSHVVWDGQSAFIGNSIAESFSGDRNSPKTESSVVSPSKLRRRSVRSLRKKDLYAAWNAMMRTPRFVRRKFRHRNTGETTFSTKESGDQDTGPTFSSDREETSGETVVWRRFMDQVCDVAYRADSKRLGEDDFHSDFGEFRHYIVEKYSYNLAKRSAGIDPADWPSCVFSSTLSDIRRQELSREKLLSKLLMTIQSFTYSCCCEASEARRALRKHIVSSRDAAGVSDTNSMDTICAKFGISGLLCDGKVILMPQPVSSIDDGSQPFNGRLGRLRYLALAVMAAAGAVAADLVQLVLAFPHNDFSGNLSQDAMDIEKPERAPVAYPILLGNVLTHVVAAMAASCGRARARSDSLELVWPVPFSIRGSFATSDFGNDRKRVDSVIEDCEGFLKLGLLARVLQVLLAVLDIIPGDTERLCVILALLKRILNHRDDNISNLERSWVLGCFSLLEAALGDQVDQGRKTRALTPAENGAVDVFSKACTLAAGAACSFLVDTSTLLQILIPGVMARYDCRSLQLITAEWERDMSLRSFEKLRNLLEIESMDEMLESVSVCEIVSNWFSAAQMHGKKSAPVESAAAVGSPVVDENLISSRLRRTQGFRAFDWPMQSSLDWVGHIAKPSTAAGAKLFKTSENEPQHEASGPGMQVEAISTDEGTAPEILRRQASPRLVTFSAKKTVPLIGGYGDEIQPKGNSRPRVAVIPTSYTDLYAELGALLPDCEQTAVCLVCGEVLDAGGKSECTRHSYKCGAGSGLFFLLQECSGLIMHKGKAAYIHSPYVDSHGETPQYRGRPLNLDLARYDHLREVWSGHAVRQQVLAERGSSRQVIVPDFY